MERSPSKGPWVGAALALAFAASVACGISVRAVDVAESPDSGLDPAGAGEQVATCAADETRCGDACVSLATSADHCGECGFACAEGMVCEQARCVPFCEPGRSRCGDACVDLATDSQNCGGCGKRCDAALVCSGGECVRECTGGLQRCDVGGTDVCVDLTTDPRHCGGCGITCTGGDVCQGSRCVRLCADGAVGDVFGPDMVGCRGRVGYRDRARLCPPGTHVCTAREWVERRRGQKPTYNYWTDDNLEYSGSSYACAAVWRGGNCYGSPMRVCADRSDPLQNQCNWVKCGLGNTSNDWFGGCQGNRTAGALCCN